MSENYHNIVQSTIKIMNHYLVFVWGVMINSYLGVESAVSLMWSNIRDITIESWINLNHVILRQKNPVMRL